MEYKFEYKDNDERESIFNSHTDLFITAEENIEEGNFLTFVDAQTHEQMLEAQILTDRINTAKVNGTTDFTEIKNSLEILLAGGSITPEQYTELEVLITPTTVAS